jgi:hypothetical protein
MTLEPTEDSGTTAIGAPTVSLVSGVQLRLPWHNDGFLDALAASVENIFAVLGVENRLTTTSDLRDSLGRAEGDTPGLNRPVVKGAGPKVIFDDSESVCIGTVLLLSPGAASSALN